jgi:hypothetical protein
VYWSLVWHKFLGRSLPLLMATLLLAMGCSLIRPSRTPKPALPEGAPPPEISQLWSEPTDLARRDLLYGPGGEALLPAPGSKFTFLAKDTTGFSPGWDVRDLPGMKWDVKLGPEAQSEVVASRVTWALGYHQPPTYYVEQWTLVGGDAPGPQPPGRFRPELPGWHKKGTWSWGRNPFVDTQPYRGLVVLMHVLNNWDLLDSNTALYEVDTPVSGARSLYVVQDLGAALGKARSLPGKATRNEIDDFEAQGFIKGVDKDGYVRFDDTRWHHEPLYERLRPADVRWTCERLGRLTPQQWQAAFRAARYEQAVADRFIGKIQEKVQLGLALGDGPSRAGHTAR